jgi:hypothetical protein
MKTTTLCIGITEFAGLAVITLDLLVKRAHSFFYYNQGNQNN